MHSQKSVRNLVNFVLFLLLLLSNHHSFSDGKQHGNG